jgi:Fic family protein
MSLPGSPSRTPIRIQANGWASNCEQLTRALTCEASAAAGLIAKAKDSQISGRNREEQQAINMRRVLEVIGQHADESDWLLTEDFIKDLNRIVLSGIPWESGGAGEYRPAGNFVIDGFQSVVFTPPPPDECPPLVADLVQHINNWIREHRGGSPGALHPVSIAAITCSRLIAIHPFANGNGRTARAAATTALMTFGYRPLPPSRDDGDSAPARTLEWYFDRHLSDYYAGLQTTYRGNWPIWVEIFAEAVQATMRSPAR